MVKAMIQSLLNFEVFSYSVRILIFCRILTCMTYELEYTISLSLPSFLQAFRNVGQQHLLIGPWPWEIVAWSPSLTGKRLTVPSQMLPWA